MEKGLVVPQKLDIQLLSSLKKILFFLIREKVLYNVLLVSAILHILHMIAYICQCYLLNLSDSLLPLLCPQVSSKSVSIPSLQIGSSVPFFYIPYICLNIWHLCFFFWLTSLCITGCRFIHLTTTVSNSFLNGWVIFYWINVP